MTIKQLDKARALLNDGYPVICISADVAGFALIHLGPMSVDVIGAMVGENVVDWTALGAGGDPVVGSHWGAYCGNGVRLVGTVAASS